MPEENQLPTDAATTDPGSPGEGAVADRQNLTPREIVAELDRFIIGQKKAKRAVSIALRNRWRRQQVAPELREEIAPKNIIMIGPTGVGKTEIARRLAKLAQAPFIKVEASKFTEVGYMGRDVESVVRDLTELAVQMVRKEELERVKINAANAAERQLVELLEEGEQRSASRTEQLGPFVVSGDGSIRQSSSDEADLAELRRQLREGELDEKEVELEVPEQLSPSMTVFGGQGMEEMELNLREMLSQMPGFRGRTKRRRVKVPEALRLLEADEAQKRLDMERIQREAVLRTEQSGIVFLDEIDKVAGRQTSTSGPDVSREGVQRDLLPIVEGSTVNTRYGPVKTDHMLFIAAGAFHVAKVSDLIPELQGRFPIRVELDSLEKGDFVRILTEPQNALTRQYEALLATEGMKLSFTEDAIESIAEIAAGANQRAENIGARRLHTILEALLDEVSFDAPDKKNAAMRISGEYVEKTLEAIMADENAAQYIL